MKELELLGERQSRSKEIFDGKILHVYQDHVILPNGKETSRELIRHIGAVCVVAVTDDEKVIMERQYRYPIDEVISEIPAGKLDSKEEDRLEAAKRELKEETGYTAKNWVDIGIYYPAAAYSDEKITMYLATGLEKGERNLDEDEFLNVEEVPIQQVVAEIMEGKITDGKTQVAVLKAWRILKAKKEITLQWLGHSCYKITAGEYSIVTDPYEDGAVPGLKPLNVSADMVICSHEHHDHNAKSLVRNNENKEKCPISITRLESFHDEENGNLRGTNTISIFEYENIRVAHFGDIGCMPTPEQIDELKGLDAVMIPIGGFYTLEPEAVRELLEKIKPRVILPMHYQGENFGYDVIKKLDDFIKEGDTVVEYDTDTISISTTTQSQIAVLKYLG